MNVTIRPAVAADFTKFIDEPLPYRVRAVTGTCGDEILAVGGIAYLPDGAHGAFFMADDKARAFPVVLHKTALNVLQDAKRRGIRRLVTFADPSIEAAERWLRRLGFSPITIDNKQVWVWQH
jgi:GNAT superfamily N-acetyltransferase